MLEDDALVQSAASEVIPGRFIVTVRDDVDPAAVAATYGLRPDFTYRAALNGFAGHIGEAARAGLLRDARVLRVEPDRTVHAFATQSNATWGLDRIDQRDLPLSGTYVYETTAASVHAYVIDTGIRRSHNDFGGRAVTGFDAVTAGGKADDCNGHGTHVAGTIGGTTYGVAKAVNLYAVRVLDCNGSGTVSGVIAGVDWVTANHSKPAVANMSLGGGASSSLDDAVRRSISSGVTYAVAAGNGNIVGIAQDACKYSPARVEEALTVGATSSNDAKTSWSNYGDCVDVFAPGASITSAWHTSDTATNTISGTSMAAPHVAGVAALYLAFDTTLTPAQVAEAIDGNSSKNKVSNSSTTNNHLVYSLLDDTSDGGGEDAGGDETGGGGDTGDGGDHGIELTVHPYKVRGVQYADLSWAGTASSNVDIYRDGAVVETVNDTGSYTDDIGARGGGSYAYQVCEEGTDTCSNTVAVTF